MGAGVNIGAPVAAIDPDGDALRYTLGGTGIVAGSGQLRTRSGVDYDHETRGSYSVTVSDGAGTDAIGVAIAINDVAESPAAPRNLSATLVDGGEYVNVSWDAPEDPGNPPLG